MLTEVVTAANVLDGFASVAASIAPNAQLTNFVPGWNGIPIYTRDLSNRAQALSARLKQLDDNDIGRDLRQKLTEFPQQISFFQSNTLPQIQGPNSIAVVHNFNAIMSSLEQILPVHDIPKWEEIANSDIVPRELAKKIRGIEASVSSLAPRAGSLEGQIKTIEEAHAAALALPTDLATLSEARDSAERSIAELMQVKTESIEIKLIMEGRLETIRHIEDTAAQLILNIDSAYSAATTAGLAGAFTERAARLENSTWIWVAMLVFALLAGGILGFIRLASLQIAIDNSASNARWIWVNAGMSLLSLAAPIWFAWLSTRQIGQRFRLAEDYAFKASVARAYEGYRREAARLDPALEARLFGSALTRLEEPPTRFLSMEEFSSPYEALLANIGFQKLVDRLPLGERADVLKALTKSASSKVGLKRDRKSPKNTDQAPSADNA